MALDTTDEENGPPGGGNEITDDIPAGLEEPAEPPRPGPRVIDWRVAPGNLPAEVWGASVDVEGDVVTLRLYGVGPGGAPLAAIGGTLPIPSFMPPPLVRLDDHALADAERDRLFLAGYDAGYDIAERRCKTGYFER